MILGMIFVSPLIPLYFSVGTILFGEWLYYSIKKISLHKNKTSQVSELLSEGLIAFSKRVISNILQLIIYLTLVLLLFSYLFQKPFYWVQIASFFIGSILMCFSTHISLSRAPKMIPRVLQHSKGYMTESLSLLFKASSVIAMGIIGLIIFGLLICYIFLGIESLIGYGVGIVLSSFFLRVGGSIYKTATDIGADIITDVDKDVPDFDHRSPATLLDISGDYVGKVTGFNSDILGSFICCMMATMIFPYSLFKLGYISIETAMKLASIPIFVLFMGLFVIFLAYFFSRIRIFRKRFNNFLLEGIYLSVLICGVSTYAFIDMLAINLDAALFWGRHHTFYAFPPYIIGLVGAILIGFTSEFITSHRYRFAKKIASQAEYGAVITMLRAMGLGLRSTGIYLIYILIMVLTSFYFAGFYGVSMAALGMLSVTPSILIAHLYSPLAENTKKLGLLTLEDTTVIKNIKKMDHIGTSTIALGNGFATGASAMATFSLFFSLILMSGVNLKAIFLVDISLLSGIFIGVTFPYVFCGLLLPGLYKTILGVCSEVSRQFKEIPFLYEDKAKPDIIKATDNIARRSMDSLIIPGVFMALLPIFIGYGFGIKMLVGFVLGTLLTGFNQGFLWANFGDVLHNAKHYIKSGHYGGQGTRTYEQMRIADNFGDSYKDLISPSINIMIKAITIIAALVVVFLL